MTKRNQKQTPKSADEAVSSYLHIKERFRTERAQLTVFACIGCLGLAFGCSLAWDLLIANGEFRLIPLFLGSFTLLLVVVHRLGRLPEPAEEHEMSEVQSLGTSR